MAKFNICLNKPGMGGYGFWLNGGSGGSGGISGISTLGNSSLYGMNITSFNRGYNTQLTAIGAAMGFGGSEVFGGNYTLSGAGFNNLQQKVDNDFYEPQGGTTLPEVQITYSNGKFSEPNYDIHAYVQGLLGAQGSGGTDLTLQFNQRISVIGAAFGAVGNTMNALYGGPILSYPTKMATFGYIQYKGAKTEFMNPKAFEKSDFTKNGGGYVNGQHFSPDDFGNYFYGVAARSMGIGSFDAIQGAGIYAIFSGSITDWTNFYGYFDEAKDTQMILRGYYGK